jgi:hypothetical protein
LISVAWSACAVMVDMTFSFVRFLT